MKICTGSQRRAPCLISLRLSTAFRSAITASLLTLSVAHLLAQVQITEFMASNTRTLRDDFGQYEDWIEIYNAGGNTVDLNGWYLTDAAGNLTKWRFPATNLTANSYLVVFASGKDRDAAFATLVAGARPLGRAQPT